MGKGKLIGGRWVDGAGREFRSVNPADGSVVWTGREATKEQVGQAVAAARGAFESWSETHLEDRQALPRRFGEKLKEHKGELAEIISRETGKPLWESNGEVDSMIGKAPASTEAFGERRRESARVVNEAQGVTRYKPFGVVAVLGPFNFPGHLPNGHIVPALLAGNTVVFKPSEMTPLVAEKTLEIWMEAGMPAGVINLVQGARETGEALVGHPGIDGVFFTGSFGAGRAISRTLCDSPGKIMALEMGGNNPLVVHRVSDLEAAALVTIQSAFITSGQRCSCARRLIVVRGQEGERFVEKLVERMGKVKVGAYTERPEPFMGPVISAEAADRLATAQEKLVSRGATVVVEMKRLGKAMLSPGLIDVTEQKEREDEEYFGPLLQLVRVKDFAQAMEEANRTKYGFAAGRLSDEWGLFEEFYRKVRAGVVNWNRPLTGASGYLPFGGVGCSGNNRPSGYFAADYCSYPVAVVEAERVEMPAKVLPGLNG